MVHKFFCLLCFQNNMKLKNQIYFSESDYNKKIINKILSYNKIINIHNNLMNVNKSELQIMKSRSNYKKMAIIFFFMMYVLSFCS